jgi:preprotein translocase subunit SecG
METLIMVVHLVTCVFLILFVLLQAGKGAEIGATFGGVSQTFFGAQGGNIFSKITTVLAFIFMASSIGLTIYQRSVVTDSVMKTEVIKPAPVSDEVADDLKNEGKKTQGEKTGK